MKKEKKTKKKKIFKLPKKIHLLGEEYEIVYVPSKKIDAYNKIGNRKKPSNRIDATLSLETKEIYIDKNIKKGREYAIWHELGHYFGIYYLRNYSETFAHAFANFIISCNKQVGYRK